MADSPKVQGLESLDALMIPSHVHNSHSAKQDTLDWVLSTHAVTVEEAYPKDVKSDLEWPVGKRLLLTGEGLDKSVRQVQRSKPIGRSYKAPPDDASSIDSGLGSFENSTPEEGMYHGQSNDDRETSCSEETTIELTRQGGFVAGPVSPLSASVSASKYYPVSDLLGAFVVMLRAFKRTITKALLQDAEDAPSAEKNKNPRSTKHAQPRGGPAKRPRKMGDIHRDRDKGQEESTSDDCSDDDNQRRRGKRRKVSKDGDVLFACPFWKKDPDTHRRCYRLRLRRIADVKNHIYRTHFPDFPCSSCKDPFSTQAELNAHIKDKRCAWRESAQHDYITVHQRKQLGRRSGDWFDIWHIVFPNRPKPASEYINYRCSEHAYRVSAFCQENAASVLAQQRLDCTFRPTGQGGNIEYKSYMERTVLQVLRSLLDKWLLANESPPDFLDSSTQEPVPWGSDSMNPDAPADVESGISWSGISDSELQPLPDPVQSHQTTGEPGQDTQTETAYAGPSMTQGSSRVRMEEDRALTASAEPAAQVKVEPGLWPPGADTYTNRFGHELTSMPRFLSPITDQDYLADGIFDYDLWYATHAIWSEQQQGREGQG